MERRSRPIGTVVFVAASCVLFIVGVSLVGWYMLPDAPAGTRRGAAAGTGLADTEWQLIVHNRGDVSRQMPDGVPAVLRFDGRHRFSADAACNRLNGTATVDGPKIIFSDASTTDVGCPGAGDVVQEAMNEAVQGPVTWTTGGNTLVLLGENGDGWRFRRLESPSTSPSTTPGA